MSKRGRPPGSSFSAEVVAEILDLLASGQNPNQIAKLPGMPNASTIYCWARGHDTPPTPTFSKDYSRARDIGREAAADAMVSIWDDAEPEQAPLLKGKLNAMMWAFSKMDKAKWGDRVAIAGDAESPLVVTDLRKLSDAELATLAALADKAKAAE